MTPLYGGYTAEPPRRVSFGWIGEAWTLFSQAAGLWILAVALMILIPFAVLMAASIGMGVGTALITAQSSGNYNPANPLSTFSALPFAFLALILVFMLLYLPFMYGGIFGMAVKQLRGEPITPSDIFSGGPVMLRMLGLIVVIYLAQFALQLIIGLATGALGAAHNRQMPSPPGFGAMGAGGIIAILLEAVTGLLLYAALLPVFALVADRVGVFEALRRSSSGMGKDLIRGVMLLVVFGLIYLVSVIPCGLGLLVTLPMWVLLSALAYRDMVGMPGLAPPAGPFSGTPSPQAGVWPPPPAAGQTPPQAPFPGEPLDHGADPPRGSL